MKRRLVLMVAVFMSGSSAASVAETCAPPRPLTKTEILAALESLDQWVEVIALRLQSGSNAAIDWKSLRLVETVLMSALKDGQTDIHLLFELHQGAFELNRRLEYSILGLCSKVPFGAPAQERRFEAGQIEKQLNQNESLVRQFPILLSAAEDTLRSCFDHFRIVQNLFELEDSCQKQVGLLRNLLNDIDERQLREIGLTQQKIDFLVEQVTSNQASSTLQNKVLNLYFRELQAFRNFQRAFWIKNNLITMSTRQIARRVESAKPRVSAEEPE